ncbi:MAG: HAD family hydrolase [Oscillospiraceae bacterium]|nr:HAD family hydrolase [Oscillospiraceae bacterium]
MITTIALDYGRVLARPASGDWFFPQHTINILGAGNTLKLLRHRRTAQRTAAKVFDDHLLHTEHEEFEQFCEYYRQLLSGCGITKNLEQASHSLAQFAVYDPKKVKFYRDVLPSIAALKKHYRVVVISDTWPSLRTVLQSYGVLPLLDDLIMSCDYGHSKGDYGNGEGGKLFHSAMQHHGIVPAQTLFVDDSVYNLDHAKALGFHTALMVRAGWAKNGEHAVVRNMRDVQRLIMLNS